MGRDSKYTSNFPDLLILSPLDLCTHLLGVGIIPKSNLSGANKSKTEPQYYAEDEEEDEHEYSLANPNILFISHFVRGYLSNSSFFWMLIVQIWLYTNKYEI